uniref:Uncharacterized protein n=1 Tax=Cygnus columbianus parvoviridae sp. TaxID=2794474 RepID=A0A8A4XDE3_9VIRU|nr:MAG: hypothetical protein [Cygnus columbianus parvoviridae sp.]
MEFQRAIQKSIEIDGSRTFLRCLRLNRYGNVIDVSGDSENPAEREFYLSWKKCSHGEAVIVLNPPDLCHIHQGFEVEDGSLIANVCPKCTKATLNKVKCHNPPLTKLNQIDYLVTDLSQFPTDMNLYEDNGRYFINKGAYASLPDRLKECCDPIHYVPESIVLRHGPQTRKRQRILVSDALKRVRIWDPEYQSEEDH